MKPFLTGKLLCTFVVLFMPGQNMAVGKAGVTDIARERSLAGVHETVPLEARAVDETLATVRVLTDELFLAVCVHVLAQPTTVKEGETVLYGKYSGTELQFEGKDYMIMRESDILAVL